MWRWIYNNIISVSISAEVIGSEVVHKRVFDCNYEYRLILLKKRIKDLGLWRRGLGVIYTPLGMVKEAIKVSTNDN